MIAKLRPCPFCGRIPTVEREENYDWLIWCKCGCVLGAFGASDEAENAWNTRVGEDLVPPVFVGQIVYAVLRPWEPTPDIRPFQVTNLVITQNKKGVWTKKFGAYWYHNGKTCDVGRDFRFDEVGEKVFFNREEAEAALLTKEG